MTEARAQIDAAGDDAPKALAAATALVAPVSAFFDQVLVMDPDAGVRQNRLGLAAAVASCLRRLGDFEELPG